MEDVNEKQDYPRTNSPDSSNPVQNTNLQMYAMETMASSSSSRKQRKQYTMTKQRENWTDEEHLKFLEALKLFDRDWKKIEKFIGSKSVIQIRSHAQKYFLKVQKNNTGEHVPPPRPKRKSSQPYPKSSSSKEEELPDNQQSSPIPSPVQPSAQDAVNPANFAHWMASNGLLPDSGVVSSATSSDTRRQQQDHLQQAQQFLQQTMAMSQTQLQGPNFSKIYSFLGTLFDPTSVNHQQLLNDMTPVDRETIQLLMHNLAVNLASQHFKEQHTFLLEQYRNVVSRTGGGSSMSNSATRRDSGDDSVRSVDTSNTSSPSQTPSPTTGQHGSVGSKSSDDSNSETVTDQSPD